MSYHTRRQARLSMAPSSMKQHSHFPLDILKVVLDLLDEFNLFTVSHVSREWRALARCHPTFWKQLSISNCLHLTMGTVELFLDQLNSRGTTGGHIELRLECVDIGSDLMTSIVAPALVPHIHRSVSLDLTIGGTAVRAFRPLFEIATPDLRRLRLTAGAPPLDIEPFPAAMFHLHESQVLEHLYLVDVPLPQDMTPLRHTLESVEAIYLHRPSRVYDAIAWVPKAKFSTFQAPLLDGREPLPRTVQSADIFACLQRLVFDDRRILSLPQCRTIPTLVPTAPWPDAHALRNTFPPTGPLWMRLYTCRRIGLFNPNRRYYVGVFTVTNAARTIIRHGSEIEECYVLSRQFLTTTIVSERLVALEVELLPLFERVCEVGLGLPQLQTLGIMITSLPMETEDWEHGKVECHALRTIAFCRRDGKDVGDCVDAVCITRAAIDIFIPAALEISDGVQLDVVLRGVDMVGGDERGARVASVRREAIYKDKRSRAELPDDERALKQMGWMFDLSA
ncbi:hypothetical protein AURDEDRAFT_177243 [Auricularia subglabra TFB-10046 SS5]|uniref:F-box domain-containing protein n=1 Tax=Auricularia subglabra (strain TFB-10046 / SS5) TaxID=717982 RepID=J0D4J7_AURST|nr:hypothetical protein AURDEDRAFT_177243 [Auricularia subglabra TFB-10046 SS5]